LAAVATADASDLPKAALPSKPGRRVWLVSELYYPEDAATGYYVTGIAEGLASTELVSVLCSQPTYRHRGVRAPRHEIRHRVEIWRCASTTLDKERTLYRLINLVTISLSLLGNALRRVEPGDVVVVTTNPPTLPFAMALATWVRQAGCVLLVHDVYPDVLLASGWSHPRSVAVRLMESMQRFLYRRMDRIIVIGRDMERLVARKLGRRRERLSLIPNWADLDEVTPSGRSENQLLARHGLLDKFVVQYSGNMGRTHGIPALADVAELLRADPAVHFLFIGGGARWRWLQEMATARALTNVTVLPYQPRSDLNVSLAACDVAIVSLAPGMSGVSVPSRMYNILAAGRPIIAIADADSELAMVVREERVGWVVPPGSAEQVVATIRAAMSDAEERARMAARGRQAAEAKYSYQRIISSYHTIIDHARRSTGRGA
jgi:colanic acid biosynthesis glycosyl transferase WcaI